MTEIWHKARGYLAAGVALVACPCHLVITLPLLLSLTAGTTLGVFLDRNPWLVVAISTALFLGGLALTFRWLGDKGESCPVPAKRVGQPRPRARKTREELAT